MNTRTHNDNRINKLIIMLGIIAAVAFATVAILYIHPILETDHVTIELGDSIDMNPTNYWLGLGLLDAKLDLSSVDYNKAGSYIITAQIRNSKYNISLDIVDSVAPEIICFSSDRFYKAGETYRAEDFIVETIDKSPVNVTMTYNNSLVQSIIEPDSGQYNVTITATDLSGNSSSRNITFFIDESPRIIGLYDSTIKPGTEFDPLLGIYAVDVTDGNLTDKLIVDVGDFNNTIEGEYTITYTSIDDNGLDTVEHRKITVSSKKANLEMPELSRDNLELLCSNKCFSYKPYDRNMEGEVIAELVEPALLDLCWSKPEGSTYGSGMIYKITPDYVYILSVEHVLKNTNKEYSIYWYDKSKSSGYVSEYMAAKDNELAMTKIPTATIPSSLLLRLKEIYVLEDSNIFDEIKAGDSIVAVAKNWKGATSDLLNKTEIISTLECGEYNRTHPNSKLCYGTYYYMYKNPSKEGMSGTATLDMKGRLLGAVSFSYKTNTGYHGFDSRIDTISQISAMLD